MRTKEEIAEKVRELKADVRENTEYWYRASPFSGEESHWREMRWLGLHKIALLWWVLGVFKEADNV